MTYADDVNLIDDDIGNAQALLNVCKDIGLAVNTRIRCMETYIKH